MVSIASLQERGHCPWPGYLRWSLGEARLSALELRTLPLERYLATDDVVQVNDSGVKALAAQLKAQSPDEAGFCLAAFEWVRDEVVHSVDAGHNLVPLAASEVLEARTGLCYAKSHLLVALLRAGGIPSGFCYQRLRETTGGLVLHGLVAVQLGGRWFRLDPRGNKPGIDAQFSLGGDRLAFKADPEEGESDDPQVYPAPAPAVVRALAAHSDLDDLLAAGLPSMID